MERHDELRARAERRLSGDVGHAEACGLGISDTARLVGHNGKVISRGGAPGLAFSYTASGQRFSPLSLAQGRWAANSHEVDIDLGTAASAGAIGSARTNGATSSTRYWSY